MGERVGRVGERVGRVGERAERKRGLGTILIKPSSEGGLFFAQSQPCQSKPRLEKGSQSGMRMLIAMQQDDVNASAGARANEVSDHIYSL